MILAGKSLPEMPLWASAHQAGPENCFSDNSCLFLMPKVPPGQCGLAQAAIKKIAKDLSARTHHGSLFPHRYAGVETPQTVVFLCLPAVNSWILMVTFTGPKLPRSSRQQPDFLTF
jgi:hypothetical protein